MMFNWLSVITGFFYVVLGILVIIYRLKITFLEPNFAFPLGGLLMLYGVFRMGRAIYRIKQEKDEV